MYLILGKPDEVFTKRLSLSKSMEILMKSKNPLGDGSSRGRGWRCQALLEYSSSRYLGENRCSVSACSRLFCNLLIIIMQHHHPDSSQAIHGDVLAMLF